MINCVNNIINNAIQKPNEKLHILLAPHDNIFESLLVTHTPHYYYILQENPSEKIEHERVRYLSPNIQSWQLFFEPNLIICNDIIGQLNGCMQMRNMLQIPMIIVQHNLAQHFVKKEDMHLLLGNLKNVCRVVAHSAINQSWHANFPIISYALPNVSEGPKTKDILIIGNFDNETLFAIQNIQRQTTQQITILNTLNSRQCLQNVAEHKIYIHLSTDITHYLLAAMRAKCLILSVPSLINNALILDGENGYIINSIDEIGRYIQMKLPPNMTNNAFSSASSNFTTENFSQKWNQLLSTMAHAHYLP